MKPPPKAALLGVLLLTLIPRGGMAAPTPEDTDQIDLEVLDSQPVSIPDDFFVRARIVTIEPSAASMALAPCATGVILMPNCNVIADPIPAHRPTKN